MAKPHWTTSAGTLATINERENYSLTLVASDSDGDSLTYTKTAGSLPPGITLSTAGVLAGVPLEVDRRKTFTFVARVTDGIYSVDRTFDLVVLGSDGPSWTTASGNILTVNDGDYIDYQLVATDQDDTIISYMITSGTLPAGLELNKTSGKIKGVVTYVNDSTQVYNFTVRASDGVTNSDRIFSITYQANEYPPRSDTSTITADTTSYSADKDDITSLYFNQAENSIIATIRHLNYNIVDVDVYDPGDVGNYGGQTTLTYSISAGSLPTGMSIDSSSGEIYGQIPLIYDTETTFTFTVQVIKSSPLFVSSTFSRQFKILVLGQGYNEISWTDTVKELVL